MFSFEIRDEIASLGFNFGFGGVLIFSFSLRLVDYLVSCPSSHIFFLTSSATVFSRIYTLSSRVLLSVSSDLIQVLVESIDVFNYRATRGLLSTQRVV